nr:hypothetical protein CFP56_71690 [Quercus suber]
MVASRASIERRAIVESETAIAAHREAGSRWNSCITLPLLGRRSEYATAAHTVSQSCRSISMQATDDEVSLRTAMAVHLVLAARQTKLSDTVLAIVQLIYSAVWTSQRRKVERTVPPQSRQHGLRRYGRDSSNHPLAWSATAYDPATMMRLMRTGFMPSLVGDSWLRCTAVLSVRQIHVWECQIQRLASGLTYLLFSSAMG